MNIFALHRWETFLCTNTHIRTHAAAIRICRYSVHFLHYFRQKLSVRLVLSATNNIFKINTYNVQTCSRLLYDFCVCKHSAYCIIQRKCEQVVN